MAAKMAAKMVAKTASKAYVWFSYFTDKYANTTKLMSKCRYLKSRNQPQPTTFDLIRIMRFQNGCQDGHQEFQNALLCIQR